MRRLAASCAGHRGLRGRRRGAGAEAAVAELADVTALVEVVEIVEPASGEKDCGAAFPAVALAPTTALRVEGAGGAARDRTGREDGGRVGAGAPRRGSRPGPGGRAGCMARARARRARRGAGAAGGRPCAPAAAGLTAPASAPMWTGLATTAPLPADPVPVAAGLPATAAVPTAVGAGRRRWLRCWRAGPSADRGRELGSCSGGAGGGVGRSARCRRGIGGRRRRAGRDRSRRRAGRRAGRSGRCGAVRVRRRGVVIAVVRRGLASRRCGPGGPGPASVATGLTQVGGEVALAARVGRARRWRLRRRADGRRDVGRDGVLAHQHSIRDSTRFT